MTTQINLTPSQAAFKFLNDLFLDPILLAAYTETCWNLNVVQKAIQKTADNSADEAAKAYNADEILTGWMGKLGYPGASPALVYAALQFWQCRGLWLWQGEYNQNFYYCPSSACQTNQYTLKILPNDGDMQVTLNGEVLTYSLTTDKSYLTLFWEQENGNSSNGSIVFYYAPPFSFDSDDVVQYAGNLFSGNINGYDFKGALLSQSSDEEEEDSQNDNNSHSARTIVYSVLGSVVFGVCVGYGYLVYASKNYKYPFTAERKKISKLQSEARDLRDKVRQVYKFKTGGKEIDFEEKFPNFSKLLKDINVDKMSADEVDRFLEMIQSDKYWREWDALVNTEALNRSPLKRYLLDLKKSKDPSQAQDILEAENAEYLESPPSSAVFTQVNQSRSASANFQKDPEVLNAGVDAEKSLANIDDQLDDLKAKDDVDCTEIVDKVEGEVVEETGG